MALRRKAKLEGLDPAEIDRLAFDRIVASASACEQSTQRMRTKLEASGFPDASIEGALGKAVDLGVLDDRRYAEMLVRSTVGAGKGLRFVQKEIEGLGLDMHELEAYQEYAALDQSDKVRTALEYLKRHPPRSKDVYGSCQRKLISRGFDFDIAGEATKLFMESI